jgi:hypothetical protein
VNTEIKLVLNVRLKEFGFDLIKTLLDKTLLFLLITFRLHSLFIVYQYIKFSLINLFIYCQKS